MREILISESAWEEMTCLFAPSLAFRMYDNAGLATITGKLYGRNTSDISRNIYFNYTRQHEARVLQAMQVVKTFADSADETDINNTLPGFYRQSGRTLSLVMEEYKGTWIFASSNVPSLYCRKR
ncbi:hypothetical protein [Citrobacter freundii]|uniref:hypothetical protein n=1 Tax=Citrobacter freundii TaxID=546 RepID=UPI00388D886D